VWEVIGPVFVAERKCLLARRLLARDKTSTIRSMRWNRAAPWRPASGSDRANWSAKRGKYSPHRPSGHRKSRPQAASAFQDLSSLSLHTFSNALYRPYRMFYIVAEGRRLTNVGLHCGLLEPDASSGVHCAWHRADSARSDLLSPSRLAEGDDKNKQRNHWMLRSLQRKVDPLRIMARVRRVAVSVNGRRPSR